MVLHRPVELARLIRSYPLNRYVVAIRQLVFPDRDTLDFNIKRARPHRHTEENAGWRILGKVALVNFVECLEALRAYAKYVHLQDVLEVRSRRLKCRLQLFQAAFGLLFKRRVDEKFSGLGIKWRQTRDEDHVAGASAGRDRHTPFLEIAVKRFDADNFPLHDQSPCTIWLFPSTSMKTLSCPK